MSAPKISTVRSETITRIVTVIFEHDNLPQFERAGAEYQVTEVSMKYQWRRGVWENPWSIDAARAKRLKSGEWGKAVWADIFQERALITELANEYKPTTTITITEQENN